MSNPTPYVIFVLVGAVLVGLLSWYLLRDNPKSSVKNGWTPSSSRRSTRQHVIPIGNGEPTHTAGSTCECLPFVGDYGLVTHHSFDKREQFERQGHIRPGNGWVVVAEENDEK